MECQSYNKNGYCPDKLNGRCKLQHNKTSQHGKNVTKKNKKQEIEEYEEEDEDEDENSSLPQQDYFSLFPKFINDHNSEISPNEPTFENCNEELSSSSENEYFSFDESENENQLEFDESDDSSSDLSNTSNISEAPPVPDFLKL